MRGRLEARELVTSTLLHVTAASGNELIVPQCESYGQETSSVATGGPQVEVVRCIRRPTN